MLFKILQGDKSRISLDITPFHEGWCYVTTDGGFYVDMNIGTKEAPNYQRVETTSRSAYQYAKEGGYTGTEQEFAQLLNGLDTEIENHNQDELAHPDIRNEISQLAKEKVDESQLTSAVETALAEAKASGIFDGYTPVKGVDYWTTADKAEMVAETQTQITDIYGGIFDTYPTEAEILAMKNNSFFKTKKTDATYYRTTSWTRNALKYTSGSTTVYVVPLSQVEGEMYLPYYGIEPFYYSKKNNPTDYASKVTVYAEKNSAIMDVLLSSVQYGTTFRLPVGHFYFARPLNLAINDKTISLIGTTNASFKNPDIYGTTWLHFENLSNGEAALNVQQCTISDFTIAGNDEQYTMELTRGNGSTVPKAEEGIKVGGTIDTEAAFVKAYGIKAAGCMNIRNIGFSHFYYGLWCETSNMAISDVTFHNCHYGLSIDCDIKVFNIFGFNIMKLLQIRGSLASAVGVRGDSVGQHLVEITGGRNHTLVDLDADFCMGAIVAIGTDDTTKACSAADIIISGVHGRANVAQYFAIGDEEKTARNANGNNYSQFGVLTIKSGSSLNRAIITTNQSQSGGSPFDGKDGYSVPYVLLTAGKGAIAKDVQFNITGCWDKTATNKAISDWVMGRVNSLSDQCDIVINTASGSARYRTLQGEEVINIADEICSRMDTSSFALKAEVVKTVNGLSPDEAGNVVVADIPPEFVNSEEECKADYTKKYVLPDGYIYAWRKKLIPKGSPMFTNRLPTSLNPWDEETILDGCGYRQKERFSVDTQNKKFNDNTTDSTLDKFTTGLIKIKNGDIVRVKEMGYHTTAGENFVNIVRNNKTGVWGIKGNGLSQVTNGGGSYISTGSYGNAKLTDLEIHVNEGTCGWVLQNGAQAEYIWFEILNTTPPESVIITVNEEIKYTSEDEYKWVLENTYEPYIKPDYLSMIAELEARVKALEEA